MKNSNNVNNNNNGDDIKLNVIYLMYVNFYF